VNPEGGFKLTRVPATINAEFDDSFAWAAQVATTSRIKMKALVNFIQMSLNIGVHSLTIHETTRNKMDGLLFTLHSFLSVPIDHGSSDAQPPDIPAELDNP
jgi:hypothetical protein